MLPHLPGAEEVEPGAETSLDDGECVLLHGLPAFRKLVVAEKHMARFFQPAFAREIHIAEMRRIGLAFVPFQRCLGEWRYGHILF